MGRIWVLVVLAGLSACAQPTTRAAQASPTPSAPLVAQRGVLGGDARLEGGCVWLDTPDARFEVLWPAGYRADADPVELRDPTGAVVATAGDRLAVRGHPATARVSSCQTGTLWQAAEVEPLP